MLLENLAFPEVEAYLQEKDTILIPVGAVEQHSPYGLIGTDFIAAECIARETGKRMRIMVAPTLAYGISPHHMSFSGSATLMPETLICVVQDLVKSFLSHGFRRIFFINGHGGNVHSIETGLQLLKADNLPGIFGMISWYDYPEMADISRELFDGKEGSHATPSEVAVTRHLRPKAFGTKASMEQEIENPEYHWPLSADEMRQFFPDGRMGSAPWLATESKGKVVIERSVDALEKKLQKLLTLPLKT
jgi:creatinine amidohydrolase